MKTLKEKAKSVRYLWEEKTYKEKLKAILKVSRAM